MVKLFTHYHCNVVVTDRLRSIFSSKLTRMGKAIQARGGKERTKLLNKWKESKWVLELKENEFIVPNRKRKPDNPVVQSCKRKCEALEKTIEETNKKLKDVSNKLESIEKSNKKLSKKLNNKKRPAKNWSELTSQYQREKKKQLSTDVFSSLSYLEDDHFEPVQCELKNKETGELICVRPNQKPTTVKEKLSESEEVLKKTMYVKERFNLSNEAYHELSMVNKSLPRSYAMQKKKTEINSKSTIYQITGEITGVRQSVLGQLNKVVTYLVKIDQSFKQHQNIRVKITGDGTSVSRSMHCIVIAFSIIRDSANPNSPGGNHTVAILNTLEDYNSLAGSLKEVTNEIKDIKSITIEDITYTIEWFLGGDLKFLALCTGIGAANSKYACVWCKCPAEDRHDIKKNWSINEAEKGARTIDEIQKLSKLPKRKSKDKETETYGCKQQPLFPFIPIDHIIPDVLHLFLRVTDVLTNLLILDLRTSDVVKKLTKEQSMFEKYIKFLNETCKVSFHTYMDKQNKNLKWRDLTGPEKLKLFKNINIIQLFPDLPNNDKIQEIWTSFFGIYQQLQSNDQLNADQLQDDVDEWITLFLSIYQTKHVTPYMHIFRSHVPQFIKIYGTLSPFSQQGLEKLNDDITKDYFRSTNHHDTESLSQLMFKLNRLEELSHDSYRIKNTHVCKLCKSTGHNSRTCPSKSKE